jgi:tripartite-type tricarboxylate transporter receptor subunit TctC
MKAAYRIGRLAVAAGAIATMAATAALAGPVADFYKGKTLTLLLSTGVGGSNDLNARLLMEHMMKYIPGKPSFVARNMPGAGHVRASN